MNHTVGVGIVGYGYAGRKFHAYLLGLADGLELRAVFSRAPERRAQAEADYGVKTYATVDELVADDSVDLVVVATPHDSHAALVCKSLEAGKHTVCDKVMALTVEQADAMVRARDRSGKVLSVFHNRRWDGDYLTVKRLLADGQIGPAYAIESTVMSYGEPRSSWRTKLDVCGGQLYDWGAHLVDHALLIGGGLPEGVCCSAQYRKWDVEVDSHLKLMLTFESELVYLIELSRLCAAPKPRWYVLGESGAFTKHGLDPQEGAMNAGHIETAEDPEANWGRLVVVGGDGEKTETLLPTERGCWTAYYDNIAAHLLRGEPLAVPAEQARDVVRVINAAMESVRTGASVTVTS